MTNFSQTAAYIWSLADLLRGDFQQSQYGRVILPFTILRRLECVLEATKRAVLAQVERLKAMPNLEAAACEMFLLRAADQSFFKTLAMGLSKLQPKSCLSTSFDGADKGSVAPRTIAAPFETGFTRNCTQHKHLAA